MTILFESDWGMYPGAIVDTQTTNKSFVRLAALYRDMGIRNHSFILALYNRDLQGVDPFDPNLTVDQMMAIALECKQNFWYFIREVAKVPGTGQQKMAFRANRGNIALYWLFFNHITLSLIQPRQTGKSFSTDELHSYCLNIGSTDTYIAMLTKDETLRSRALTRLKDIIDELPFYLNQKTKKDVANTEEISIKRLDNRYKGLLPSKSPKMAMNVGRGLTAPIFHVDEIAFIYNVAITLPAALPATTAARAIAESKSEPYGNIFTTTAGKKDDTDGKYAYEIVSNSAVWNEKFLDSVNLSDLEKTIRLNSPGGELRVNCTFSHRQLGYTDEWLKEQLEITGSKGEDADRDYFNIWTAGSQTSPFPVEIAERIRRSEVPDPFIDIAKPYNYITRWYIPLEAIEQRMATTPCTLGVDTSDAVGNDDIGMVLRDIKTGEVLADSNINETNLIVYAKWLASWLIKYDNITLIIERRSSGSAILDLLLILLVEAGINPFQRIYNKVVQEKDEKPERFAEVDKRYAYNATEMINKYKATFGFATSGGGVTSRSELYSTTLTNATKTTADIVRSKPLIDQLLGLTIKNGRVDHQTGSHDDLCFVGSTLVRTIHGNKPISKLKIGDLVLTRQGYKPIINIFCNEREVITKFGITGTPEHPFITPSGEVQFKDLTLKSKVYIWNEKQSLIMEKTIIDTLSLKEIILEIISIDTIKTMNPLSRYIDKFGKIAMDLFQKDIRFIIKTIIPVIIPLKISNVSQPKNIEVNMQYLKKLEKNIEKTPKKINHSITGEKITQSLLNKQQKKTEAKAVVLKNGEKKIQNLLVKWQEKAEKKAFELEKSQALLQKDLITGEKITQSLLKNYRKKMEKRAVLFYLNGIIRIREFAQKISVTGEKIIPSLLKMSILKPLKRRQKPELKKEIVYNLTVAECHEYFVNDILVHNCIGWLLSYWLMTQGKNLYYYNINTRDILCNNIANKSAYSREDQYEAIRQKGIQEEITKLVETIQNEKNDFLVFKYEARLKRLASELNNEEAMHSIDKLLESIKETKRISRKTNNTFRNYGGYSSYR